MFALYAGSFLNGTGRGMSHAGKVEQVPSSDQSALIPSTLLFSPEGSDCHCLADRKTVLIECGSALGKTVCAVSLPGERIRGNVNELLSLVVKTPQAAFKERPLLSGSTSTALSLVGGGRERLVPDPSGPLCCVRNCPGVHE